MQKNQVDGDGFTITVHEAGAKRIPASSKQGKVKKHRFAHAIFVILVLATIIACIQAITASPFFLFVLGVLVGLLIEMLRYVWIKHTAY